MTNQIEILKQMFESLSDNQKADFLDYLQPKTSKISIHDLILKSNTIKYPHCSLKEESKLTELKEFICNIICLTKGYSIINRKPIPILN